MGEPLPAGSGPHRSRHYATLVLCGGWLIFFGRYFIDLAGVPYYRDLSRLYIPARTFMHFCLRNGHLPQWFPYELLGVPFMGQIVTATFHPQTLIFLPFAPVTAIKLNIAFDYLVGAAGAYRMARALPVSRPSALVAAFALAFGGYAVGVHCNPPYLLGMMTLPWVGWGALRLARHERWRDVVVLAVAWALVFLGGDIQGCGMGVVVVIGALVAGGAKKRAFALAAAVLALALALISIELLPAIEVFAHTFRLSTDARDAAVSVWALHPWRLVELLLPGAIPEAEMTLVTQQLLGAQNGALWSSTVFAGAVAVSLALVALVKRDRRAIAFGVLSLLGIWMALGSHAGLLPIAARIVPVLGRFAYPEKYLALFFVGFAALSALGAERAMTEPRRAMISLGSVGVLVGGLMTVTAQASAPRAVFSWAGNPIPEGSSAVEELSSAWSHGFGASLVFVIAAIIVLVLARRRPVWSWALPALVLVELWLGNGCQIVLADRDTFENLGPLANGVVGHLSPDQVPPRVQSTGGPVNWSGGMFAAPNTWARGLADALRPDTAAVHGIGVIGEAMFPALSDRIISIATTEPTPWGHWLHACWRVAGMAEQLAPGEVVDGFDELLQMRLIRQSCFRLAFLAGAQPVATMDEAWTRIRGGLPKGFVVWEGGPVASTTEGRAELLHYVPGEIMVSTHTEKPSALIISEAVSSGWAASVDGIPTPIFPANIVAQGVGLPAGAHVVVLKYETPHLRIGALISLLALAGCVAVIWRTRRQVQNAAA